MAKHSIQFYVNRLREMIPKYLEDYNKIMAMSMCEDHVEVYRNSLRIRREEIIGIQNKVHDLGVKSPKYYSELESRILNELP